MATCIHPGLVSRLFIPSLYSDGKIFHLLVSFPFFAAHCIYSMNTLPWAIYCWLHTCVYVLLSELCYLCTPTFIATIANMDKL